MTKRLVLILLGLLLGSYSFAQVIPGGGPVSSGPSSSIIGNLQTATGGNVKNGTLSFTLSQPAMVSGTASIAPSTESCYTAGDGHIVGVPDPLVAPVISVFPGSGVLPAGTYYVKLTYVGAGGESNPSPEAVAILPAQGAIVVNAPAIQPTAATGFFNVYIGTTPGSETLQGAASAWNVFSQNNVLTAGTAPPTNNTSGCSVYFSDQLIPTGTSYSVGLVNKNGSTIAGFPQTWCTYGGAGSTINVSNGAPTGNCGTNGVFYPTPIFANPQNNSQQSVNGPIAFPGGIFGPVNATGPWTFTNPVTAPALDNIQFADLAAGSDASCKIQTAINATPTNGGVVDARNLTDSTGIGACAIDPGTKPISLWLGPRNYHLSRIVLRSSFEIRGFGSPGGSPDSVGSATTITSTNTTGELFSLAPYNGHAAANVFLHGFGVFGPGNTTGCTSQLPSATTNAFLLDANQGANSALWYSRFDDLFVCGFMGNGIYFKGNAGSGGTHQFNTFTNVIVGRAVGGNSALRVEGSNYQLHIINSQFDANCGNTCIDAGSTNPNIFLGPVTGGTAASYPYIIKFDGLTSQGALTAVQIAGAKNVSFYHPHHEENCIAYRVTFGDNGVNVSSDNIIIDAGSFNGNVAKGAGVTTGASTCTAQVTNAAVLRTDTAFARGISLNNSTYLDASAAAGPDNLVYATQGSEVATFNNEVNTVGTWNPGSGAVQQTGALTTAGMTLVTSGSATHGINTGHTHFIAVNSATNSIQTINSTLATGESITFGASVAGVQFTTGGNLSLGGHPNIFLNPGDSATFTRNDALSGNWQLSAMAMGPDGGMAKAKRFASPLGGTCPTGGAIGNACTSANLTWTTAFADNTYSVSCTLEAVTNQPHIVNFTKLAAGAGITLTIATDLASAANAGADCLATHD